MSRLYYVDICSSDAMSLTTLAIYNGTRPLIVIALQQEDRGHNGQGEMPTEEQCVTDNCHYGTSIRPLVTIDTIMT